MKGTRLPMRGIYILARPRTFCYVHGCTHFVRQKRGEGGWVLLLDNGAYWCPSCAKRFAVAWEDTTDYSKPLEIRSVCPS